MGLNDGSLIIGFGLESFDLLFESRQEGCGLVRSLESLRQFEAHQLREVISRELSLA